MQPWPTLPDYELLHELGGGPFTQVFFGRHRRGGFSCAVKTLRSTWSRDTIARQFIAREARVGLAVRHRHLVKMFDAQSSREPEFVVMELLNGESLRECLSREFKLDVRTVVWVARQVAEAISALHRAGFVHGDVKPENVLLRDAGGATLIDLGTAHRPGEISALLQDGFLLGTAEYFAPELCELESDHILASDWYSFGLMLFEMLTGELPYPKCSFADTLERHITTDLTAIIRLAARKWPRRLTALVEQLTGGIPADRPFDSDVIRELTSLETTTIDDRLAA